MLSLLKNYVGDAAAPVIFLVLFLVIVGGSLWITPRLAAWLDKRSAANQGYFDGMLEEDPGGPDQDAQDAEKYQEENGQSGKRKEDAET